MILNLNDKVKIKDAANLKIINERISAGPKTTKITFVDHDTGEVLGIYHNKVVITGAILNATNAWGLENTVAIPSYNDAMHFDNDVESGTTPENHPILCLFCVDDSGCGSTPKDIYEASFVDRIAPAPASPASTDEFTGQMIMPFRWVDINEDLPEDLRPYYFGRKTFDSLGKIGYYFKCFDTDPTLHLEYADGTEITENIYESDTNQDALCFVETRLRISRLDFRDYFDQVLGWDNARISSLSLCYAWYDEDDNNYKYFQDIFPYTKLNFAYEWLVDATKAIDIIYDVYY